MSEKESFATVHAGDETYEVFRENATVYRHLGNKALDHVFVSIEEDKGVYVWESNPMYAALATLAVQNECMLVLNIPEPSEMDVKAYMKHHSSDVDTVPDWLPEL